MKKLVSKILSFSALMLFVIACMQLNFDGNKANGASLWKEDSAPLSADAQKLNNIYTDLAEKLSPAVVNIFTKSQVGMEADPNRDLFQFFFGHPGMPQQPRFQQREAQSLGSGFVINDDGLVITNSHVVRFQDRNADQVRVKFLGDPENSEGHEAMIIGVDPSTDVAVLKLKDKKRVKATAPFGDSSTLKVGEWVLAIGNPFGHTHTVTQGIVSALGRSSTGLDIRSNFIQTDASINPGNSGGPLFNLKGEVIGINTAIDARGPGIGFTIPINTAKSVIKQLVAKGEVTRGWIGIVGSDLNPQIAKRLGLKDSVGALVQDVSEGGPAQKAGLESYDVITKVGKTKVGSMRDLAIAVGGLQPGEKVAVEYIHDGKVKSTTLTIQEFPKEASVARGRPQRGGGGPAEGTVSQKVGVVLGELNVRTRQRFRIPADVSGVLIADVMPRTPAAQSGLRAGDVIKEINQKPVKNVRDAERAFKRSKRGVLLRVQSGAESIILSLEFEK
ncbi:Do family serine endopeptidase [bacterium]|nr:Do family serine endopeptidase [bacterium]